MLKWGLCQYGGCCVCVSNKTPANGEVGRGAVPVPVEEHCFLCKWEESTSVTSLSGHQAQGKMFLCPQHFEVDFILHSSA